MIHTTARTLAALAVCIGCVGCGVQDRKPREQKPKEQNRNIGDRYVRGTLGAGQKAQETVGLMAINKAVNMYQLQHGKNPASLQELNQQGFLIPMPKPPPGKRFTYDPATGQAGIAKQ